MEPLTATEQATLDVLNDQPATSAEVRDRSGRSRSATDKALAVLANAGLAAKLVEDIDYDGPTRWVRVLREEEANESAPHEEPVDQVIAIELPPAGSLSTEEGAAEASIPEQGDSIDEPAQDLPATSDDSSEALEENFAPEVKLCRGCQNQMPVICPCCWTRTPAYCGDCRKKLPARQRGNPREPQILPNGLPKLTRGQLEQLVAAVMRDHPLPDHVGVTGWTSARIAVFLPGRSTGAIGNALDRLVNTGQAELLSGNPKLYRSSQTPEHLTGPESQAPTKDDEQPPTGT